MKTPFLFTAARWLGSCSGLQLAATLGIGLVCSTTAKAQFPRVESFKNTATSGTGFRLGGTPNSAVLTAASGIDANGAGYLRLTDNGGNQSGFAIDNSSFPAPSGFSISFEFFSYGGNGADGFSVFLIDADKTSAAAFTSGASGGSLGYAQKTVDPVSNGVPNGYVGIGIDEFGNFSNPTEGRVGGPGPQPDAVTLRGPGNGQSTTDYPYLAGSGTLPFSLDVATTRAQQGSPDFRRAYIDVIPQPNGTYQITVRIQYGNAVATAVNRVTVNTPPANLRIGFSGSTGGSNNYHEIRNLAIVKAPFANDDVAGTKYNVPVNVSILNNDIAQGSNLNPASVDLDPSTPAVDNTYTVAGQGIFSVNSSGVLTFTPSGAFSGTVTIPYTVASVLGDRSSPANITVTVTGADVATTVNGPSSVNPGSTTSYTVTAVNNGQEVATNLIPTLTLPANVTYVSGGSYNAGTRVVSFPQITLNSGESVTNSVVVKMPAATGSYSFVSNYTYPSGAIIPDAVAGNNSSSFPVLVTGAGNIAGVCYIPGKDGPGSLSAGTIPNTYYAGVGTASTGNAYLTVGTTPSAQGSSTPIAAGDMLLILQTQGTKMTIANGATYGDVNTITAGTYEYAIAAGSVNPATGRLDLAGTLQNTYSTSTTTNISSAAYQTFQVIRIPQYSALTVSGTVTGAAWNGSTGGVLALEVAGNTSFSGGSLNMDGKGFRGGAAKDNSGSGSNTVYTSTGAAYGAKGEGIAGAPAQVYDGTGTVSSVSTSYDDFATGSYSIGKAANGGGGGIKNGAVYTGGAGGSNGGAGGNGQTLSSVNGGMAGAINSAPSGKLYLGGGGGSGTSSVNNNGFLTSSGRAGGGLIILRTNSVATAGTVSANGASAATLGASVTNSGGGGGGAGGTVVVRGTALNQLTVTATGGNGGFSQNEGNGGAGGGGVVLSNVAVGSASVANGTVNGTSNGSAGYTSTSTSLGTDCMPNIAATLRTTTPQVNRSAAMQAAYVLVVSNTGGGVTGASVTAALNPLFTYTNTGNTTTVEQILADGTASPVTGYTVSTSTASSPVFSGLNIPAGASLRISFRAAIASSAVNGTAYQADGTAAYLDPTRTAAGSTVSPGGTMASGTAASGSNYLASSSTAEDVTVVRPLPVTLISFEAKAAGQNALLTWSTAQEVNNDRFEVERSLNGVDFEKVGTVKGQGTISVATPYRFTDAGAARLTSKTIYYRLHQVDLDGPGSYTAVRTVRFERLQGTAAVYPNPHQGRFTLDLQSLPISTYQVDVLDLAGRRVYHTQLSGGQEHPLAPALPMGSYVVRITGQTVNINLPMVKQ